MVRKLKTSLSVLICVGVGLARKRTLAANGMSTRQQVKIWCLDTVSCTRQPKYR